jgi:hypothetical protein
MKGKEIVGNREREGIGFNCNCKQCLPQSTLKERIDEVHTTMGMTMLGKRMGVRETETILGNEINQEPRAILGRKL